MSFILAAGGTTNSVNMTAAGTIAAGQPCIVTAAGTAAQVRVTAGGTAVVNSGPLSGTYGSSPTGKIGYDPVNNLFLAISTVGASATVVAGRINSFGSVTYGTPVVFGNTSTADVVFDSNANRFLIVYSDAGNSNFPTARVATVTPASLAVSLGTAVVAESVNVGTRVSAAYVATAQKTLIVYSDGTTGKGIVASITGTSVSYGANATFSSTGQSAVNVCFSPTSSNSLITYANAGLYDCLVATVSGTSVSFGAIAAGLFNGIGLITGVVFDVFRNQFIIGRDWQSNGFHVSSVAISGTTVSFVATTGIAPTGAWGSGTLLYDAANNITVALLNPPGSQIARTITNSGSALTFNTQITLKSSPVGYLTGVYSTVDSAVVALVDGTQTNLIKVGTSNLGTGNYVGIATNAASVGGTVTINTVGNTATISGLTPGSNYAVLATGGLGTTTTLTLGTYAGVAITNTTLLLKG